MAIPPDLGILYPNGQVEAVQMYIWDGSKPIPWDGSVTFSGSLPSTVAGNKTNNAAAPGTNNLGALVAIANAAAQTWTEGREVLLSTDLSGNLRVAATVTPPAAPTTVTNGKKLVTTAGTRVTLAGSTTVQSVTIKALATNTGTIFVGNSSVSSSNGFQLAAGDSVSLDIANLNTVNIDSSIDGEGVTYLAVN